MCVIQLFCAEGAVPVPPRSAGRAGMTLVELLLSIAIVATLTAIVIPSVATVYGGMNFVRTREEIHQLSLAAEHFKLRYGHYPPSKIRLRECGGYDQPLSIYDAPDGLDQFSADYLAKLFKGIDLELHRNSRGELWHDWNGNGKKDEPVVLEGDECLVFFLGGIPSRDPATGMVVMTGFNPDRSRPAAASSSSAKRDGPFYEFAAQRLQWPFAGRPQANHMPVYLDYYGMPYLYFRTTPKQCQFV